MRPSTSRDQISLFERLPHDISSDVPKIVRNDEKNARQRQILVLPAGFTLTQGTRQDELITEPFFAGVQDQWMRLLFFLLLATAWIDTYAALVRPITTRRARHSIAA